MKKIALVALLLSTTAGYAADLPSKIPTPYIPPPLLTWTGFYAGASMGYGWGSSSNTISGNDVSIGVPVSTSGFIGGVYGGYQYQFGSWVAGLETDLSWANVRGGNLVNGHIDDPVNGSTPFAVQFDNRLTWLGTTRGRLGFLAMPALMIYGTGGLAYGGVNTDVVGVIGASSINSNLAQSFSSQDTRVGWSAGAGVEYAVTPNILVRTEWIHYNLGATSHPAPGDLTVTSHNSGDLARVGMAYKF